MADNEQAKPLHLYRVTSDIRDEYDTFQECVVYAHTSADAKSIVLSLCRDRDPAPEYSGSWMPLADGAQLTATRVSIRPGPVMGYSREG